MGYKALGTVEGLVDLEDEVKHVSEMMAYRMAYEILERVKRYTPVAVRQPNVGAGTFRSERGGRKPGTLKESWEIGHLRKVANRYVLGVYTEDPIAPYVEFDTRPHRIKAKPGKMLRFRSSRTGEVLYRASVLHPGTTGVHMMERAMAEVDADADRLLASTVRAQWGRTRATGGTGRRPTS